MTTQQLETKQPKAFSLLFLVEMWERFGYYGVASLLVLFMTKVFHFSDDHAYSTFAALSALIYITPIIGGYLGDHVIGYQRTLVTGAILLLLGYGLLAFAHGPFYLALAFIIVGSGFFKTAPSTLLGKVYGANDARVDSGFTLFYMSINIGSIISIIICGFLQQHFNWYIAFAACSFGLLLGVSQFLWRKKLLAHIGSPADLQPVKKLRAVLITIGSIAAIWASALLMQHQRLVHQGLVITGVVLGIFFISLLFRLEHQERRRFAACIVLTIFAISFFALYFQAPTTITLFVDRNVDRHLLGFILPASSYYSLNPFWILVLAPLLALTYNKLALKKGDWSISLKFAVGIILMGLGFLVLDWSRYFANAQGLVSSWWVVLSYFLQSLAELLVSAIGLGMITRLSPHKYLGLMYGTWFLATAAAASIAGKIAEFASVPKGITSALQSLPIYASAFDLYGGISVAIGVLALLFVIPLNKLIGE